MRRKARECGRARWTQSSPKCAPKSVPLSQKGNLTIILRCWCAPIVQHEPAIAPTQASTPDCMHNGEKDEWRRVNRETPCPICGRPDWCRIGTRYVHCMRIESPKPAKNAGWYHPLDASVASALPPPEKAKPRKTDAELHRMFRADLERWSKLGDAKVLELAAILGVNADCLKSLHVTWTGYCWATPERTPEGMIVGLATRSIDGQKWMMTDSRHGLVFPADLPRHRDEPILLVEGMSDTAAAMTIGISAVGRPNNQTGGKMLAKLLANWRGRIVVMGEYDWREPKPIPGRQPHPVDCQGCMQCFPGKYGAMVIAKELRKTLKPPVSIRMPPGGSKDLRTFTNSLKVDPCNVSACHKIGKSLLRRMGIR